MFLVFVLMELLITVRRGNCFESFCVVWETWETCEVVLFYDKVL